MKELKRYLVGLTAVLAIMICLTSVSLLVAGSITVEESRGLPEFETYTVTVSEDDTINYQVSKMYDLKIGIDEMPNRLSFEQNDIVKLAIESDFDCIFSITGYGIYADVSKDATRTEVMFNAARKGLYAYSCNGVIERTGLIEIH